MNQHLVHAIRRLRLSGLLASLELRLQEAASHSIPHEQFLELILQDELNARGQRLIEKRCKKARFRDRKSLEDFDWNFNPTIKRQPIYQLASCAFIREHRDVLFLGPPGLGKSHIAQSLGNAAIRAGFDVLYQSIFDLVRELQSERSPAELDRTMDRYLKADLLIVDDFGLKTLPAKAGEILLELILRRYENRSTIMTSNRPIEEWGKLLNDVPTATAILDRFLHHAEVIHFTGRSFRMEAAVTRAQKNSGPKAEEKQ